MASAEDIADAPLSDDFAGQILRNYKSRIYSLLSEAAAKVHVDNCGFAGCDAGSPITTDRAKRMDNTFMARAIQLSIETSTPDMESFRRRRGERRVDYCRRANRVTSTNDPTAHAEVVVIREACQKLGGFDSRDARLHFLRALSHVPGSNLLGSSLPL